MREIDKKMLQQLDEHQEQLNRHQEQLNGHQEQLNGHQEQLSGHQEQLNGHQEQLNGHQEQLNGHQEQLNEHLDMIEDIQLIIEGKFGEDAREDNNIVQEQLNGHQEQLKGHQEQLAMHQRFMDRLQEQLNRQREIIENLKNETGNQVGYAKCESGLSPYGSVEVEGIKYIFCESDKEIPNSMLYTGINYSKDLIDEYIRISDQIFYKGQVCDKGLFLDIGGNIGTTTIYCKKKLKLNYNFLAFEPVHSNAQVFMANCFLNDVAADVICEEVALSSETTRREIWVSQQNMGGCKSIEETQKEKLDESDLQEITTVTLDQYLMERNVNIQDIKYIWIDTEGHEWDVLYGAKSLFSTIKVPVCIEYNQDRYKQAEKYEKMLQLLGELFTCFCEAGREIKNMGDMRPISDLEKLWQEKNGEACDIVLF